MPGSSQQSVLSQITFLLAQLRTPTGPSLVPLWQGRLVFCFIEIIMLWGGGGSLRASRGSTTQGKLLWLPDGSACLVLEDVPLPAFLCSSQARHRELWVFLIFPRYP